LQLTDLLLRSSLLLLGWVRVRALFIHPLYPQLAREDGERREERYREHNAHQPEERAHYQEREDYDRRM